MTRNQSRTITANIDVAGGILLLAVAAVALLYARGGSFNVWVFPRAAAVFMAAIGVGLIVKGKLAPKQTDLIDRRNAVTTVLPFAAGLILFALLFGRVGFVPMTILLFSLTSWVLRGDFTLRSAVISFAIGTVATVFMHQIFTRAFYVPLPSGSWWRF